MSDMWPVQICSQTFVKTGANVRKSASVFLKICMLHLHTIGLRFQASAHDEMSIANIEKYLHDIACFNLHDMILSHYTVIRRQYSTTAVCERAKHV